jgi:prepilin-type N-terminal cleavage/methylation domain-containing protein
MKRQHGFTLIEIAIVLVIMGLLLGGVLKGQELITSARVRNMVSQQDGIKAAYFGFLDRFRALPGDYVAATTNINGATKNGDGDGQIEKTNGTDREDVLAWEHLSQAGFIAGAYKYATDYSPTSGLVNPYGSYIVLRYDADYGDSGTASSRHNLKTGAQVPADILAEMDRKIDDGNPYAGSFRFATRAALGTDPVDANCVVAGTGTPPGPAHWKITGGSVEANCAGATLF